MDLEPYWIPLISATYRVSTRCYFGIKIVVPCLCGEQARNAITLLELCGSYRH